jgi:hypothetical protein
MPVRTGVDNGAGMVGSRAGVVGDGAGMRAIHKVLIVAGVLLVLAGVGMGFHSVSAAGADCGSVFQPAAGITPMACDGRLNNSGTLVTLILVAGGLCLAAALTVKVVRDRVTA